LKRKETRSEDDARVFTCMQITTKSVEMIAAWAHGNCVVKASVPEFNRHSHVDPPQGAVLYNLPCFGVRIPRAIMRVFDVAGVRALSDELGIPIPRCELDTFVQKKMKNVLAMVEFAKRREDCASGANQLALEKLKKFAEAFREPPGIASDDAFSEFVHQYVPSGWEDRLHFSRILTDNFGLDAETAESLRFQQYTYNDKGTEKEDTFERYSMRWLGKAFKGYSPVGCLTDVVNLIYAMVGQAPPEYADEHDIVRAIDDFRVKLEKKDLGGMWIPTHLCHDAESDDSMCWLLLEHVRRLNGTQLEVLVQLPTERCSKDFEQRCASISSKSGSKSQTFLDPDSENASQIKKHWAL